MKLIPKLDNDKCISSSDCELQRIELCSNVQKNIVLYNIYRPPSGNVNKFTECLVNVLEGEDKIVENEVMFLGDFNINFSSKKSADTKKLVTWQNRFWFDSTYQNSHPFCKSL